MHATTNRGLTRLILPAIAIGAGALVAGCGDDDKDDAAAKPAAFAITATTEGKQKTLEFPATVKAGVVTLTLTNSDTVPRSAGIARLVGNHTVDEYIDTVNTDEEGAPIPAWIEDGGGVGAVEPGETVTVSQILPPGKYAIADDETKGGQGEGETYGQQGAKGEFTVTGEATDVELPAQPATITATDDGGGDNGDYGFEFKGLKAGTNKVRFENTGEQLHHAIMFPIAKGKTIADVEAAFGSDEPPKGPPPVDFSKIVGTQVIDGGIAQNIELDLPAANYAVVCFIQDRKGGKPHVEKGMIDELTVE